MEPVCADFGFQFRIRLNPPRPVILRPPDEDSRRISTSNIKPNFTYNGRRLSAASRFADRQKRQEAGDAKRRPASLFVFIVVTRPRLYRPSLATCNSPPPTATSPLSRPVVAAQAVGKIQSPFAKYRRARVEILRASAPHSLPPTLDRADSNAPGCA
jgi:hypothetical protein